MVFSGTLLLKSGDLQMYLRVEVNARQAFKWVYFFFFYLAEVPRELPSPRSYAV